MAARASDQRVQQLPGVCHVCTHCCLIAQAHLSLAVFEVVVSMHASVGSGSPAVLWVEDCLSAHPLLGLSVLLQRRWQHRVWHDVLVRLC